MNHILEIKNWVKSIGEARGLGRLMIGMKFIKEGSSPDKARLDDIMKKCLEAGLVIIECGVDKNIARIMPPLTVTKDEMDLPSRYSRRRFLEV